MAASTLPPETEAIAREVVDSVFKVHKELGPGLLESVYEACLVHELGKRRIPVQRQKSVPVRYDGETIDTGLRLDLVIADRVIVELKVVDHLLPVHRAQIITYLKLTGLRLGLLVNFNVALIKDGIHRFVR